MNQESIMKKDVHVRNHEDSFLQGVKDCVPTLLGYLSIGFAAGVVEKTAGLSIAEIALMSLLLYAGSTQFIAAGMIMTSSPVFAIVFTVFFVNLRHLLLSAALAPYFRKLPTWKNIVLGAQLTDETFGVAINHLANKTDVSARWMFGLNLTAYLNWFAANMAGAFFGQWIADPERYGLDFALPAMFIGLLIIQIVSRNKLATDLLVLFSAMILIVALGFVIPGSMGLIVATVLASTIGVISEKWR